MKVSDSSRQRCSWVGKNKPHYEEYHDHEWGRPVYEDQHLFEMLILEGAQAGLSWETILKRRENYRRVFRNFDSQAVSLMTDQDLESALLDTGIVRNRLKVFSVRKNALVFLEIQKEFGSFFSYLWSFVGGEVRKIFPKNMADVSARTVESDALSQALKKRGMSFVGSTIMYAYMQAVGLVNDHLSDCFLSESA